MQTEVCRKLGIDFPGFAFTHCRDVVAAVSNSGGFGVLGAVGFHPEQLKIELDWIDAHVDGQPYGVDVIIPNRYQGQDEKDPDKLRALISAAIPRGHRDFADELLDAHGVPRLPSLPRSGVCCSPRRVPTELAVEGLPTAMFSGGE